MTRIAGTRATAAALLALATPPAALAGCGGGDPPDRVVARVGATPITRAQLQRRMAALAPEGVVPDAPRFAQCVRQRQAQVLVHALASLLRRECAQQYDALRRQALSSLIVSRWLIGEAVERGLLSASPTGSDAAVQAAAATAERKLRASIDASEPRVGRAQALRYYRANRRAFERRELRYVDLAENFPTIASAAAAKRRIEARGGVAGLPLHEVVERFNTSGRSHTTEAGKDAIFSARPGVVGGPVELTRGYTIFEVIRIAPPSRRPFAAVERSIARRLQAARQRRSLAELIAAWRARWRARTSCAAGYVVQGCRNYHGARERGGPLAFD